MQFGLYQSMCMEVGLALSIDPRHVYVTWYTTQLVSAYSYIMNRKHRQYYLSLDVKEQAKHPSVLIERILTEEEQKQYTAQEKRKVFESLKSLTKPHGKHR